VVQVLEGALASVQPDLAVQRMVRWLDGELVIDGESYTLDGFGRIRLLGVGKAASTMVRPLWEQLGDRLDGCLVIGKREERGERFGGDSVEFLDGAHPTPDRDSVVVAERAVDFVSPLGREDLLLVTISGGTSSLLTLPAHGLELGWIAATTEAMLAAGAPIEELNVVRKHLSRVKGGQLARLAAPARIISLILSDVVGNSVSTIGSGPTAPDTSTFQDARRILSDYNVESLIPEQILAHLDAGIRGERSETLQPDDPHLKGVRNIVVASNESVVNAALQVARKLGFQTELRDGTLAGEARKVGECVANDIRRNIGRRGRSEGPSCWVYGGETTVLVRGAGRGGRNQELALSAGLALDGVRDVMLVAFATDGIDGPTDAAGAIATGSTVASAKRLGLDANSSLDDNDSYALFDALGDLLRTGPTGTNVADLLLVFMWN
jgi:glycerate 2-kinase